MNKEYTTIEEFTDVIESMICEEFSSRGVKVRPVRQVVCRQNQTLHTIAFRFETGLAPVFYIDRVYEFFINIPDSADETMRSITEGFVDSCVGGGFFRDEFTSMSSEILSNFEAIRGSIFPRLCSVELNSEFLTDKPHFLLANNLACFFAVKVDLEGYGAGNVTVTNFIMEQYFQVNAKTLRDVAFKNLEKEGYFFGNVNDVLFDMLGLEDPSDMPDMDFPDMDIPMLYVMSNMTRQFGASVIADSFLMKEAYKKLGEPFYVIPSSIHEVLLLPKSNVEDPEVLLWMVCEVNQEKVPVCERLANHIYLMDDLESFKVRCVL